MTLLPRDAAQVDALVTDGYLESLMDARDRRAADTPSVAELEPAVRAAALRLSTDLVRVHPSFRFEERLAARLAETARRIVLGAAAAGSLDPGILWTGRDPSATGLVDLDDPARPEVPVGLPRPLVIGGKLASAALSLAGAAIVAWRLSRPATLDPMSRAVRAAHQRSERMRIV